MKEVVIDNKILTGLGNLNDEPYKKYSKLIKIDHITEYTLSTINRLVRDSKKNGMKIKKELVKDAIFLSFNFEKQQYPLVKRIMDEDISPILSYETCNMETSFKEGQYEITVSDNGVHDEELLTGVDITYLEMFELGDDGGATITTLSEVFGEGLHKYISAYVNGILDRKEKGSSVVFGVEGGTHGKANVIMPRVRVTKIK